MIAWLLTNALTAAVLAGVVYAVIRVGKPAPGVRHALWLIVMLKLVSPVEFLWSVPVAVRPAPVEEEIVVVAGLLPPLPVYGLVSEELIQVPLGADAVPVFAVEESAAEETVVLWSPATAQAPPRPAREFQWEWWLLAVWVAGGAAVFVRMTRDTWRFGRFARHAKKAPDELVGEVAVVANRLGLRTPAVKVLAGLASPVMWCVGRPVLLWPADLDKQVTGDGRRAVIAHELAHLRRRDHWVRRLEMLAAVAHWWNPIFWLARRRLRADAELACDQWAAAQADRRAYAEALLAVCSFQPRRRPAPAVGVSGEGKRDMQERLTLIMKPTTPSRAADAAKLCVCLVGLAAVPAWTLGQAPAPAKPESTKAPDGERLLVPAVTADDERFLIVKWAETTSADTPEAKAIQEQIKALTAKLAAMPARRAKAQVEDAAIIAEKAKEIEQYRRTLRRAAVQSAEPQKLVAGKDGVKVIGPDGKEITGVTVIIDPSKNAATKPPIVLWETVPAAPAPVTKPQPPAVNALVPAEHPGWPGYKPPGVEKADLTSVWTRLIVAPTQATPGTVTLSRATYKLPKDQAATLATLLGTLKHAVMETKADGDTLVVTTTPEVQAVVQRFVAMLVGDKVYGFGPGGKPVGVDFTQDGSPLKFELKVTDKPDDATLLRRLLLDVRGTPPTAEELQGFLKDADPEKYAKLAKKYADAAKEKAVENGLRWLYKVQTKPAETKDAKPAAEAKPAAPAKPAK